jgi:hypothetical protein
MMGKNSKLFEAGFSKLQILMRFPVKFPELASVFIEKLRNFAFRENLNRHLRFNANPS